MQNGQLLLAVVLKVTMILAAAGLLSVCLRRAAAATRHLVWSLALGALLLLPLLTWVLPAWRVAVLPAAAGPVAVAPMIETEAFDEPLPVAAPAPAISLSLPTEVRPTPTPLVWDWERVALLLWGACVLLVVGRLALGTWRMRRVTRAAECLTDYHWSALTTRLRAQLELRAHISLYGSEEISVPVTWGVWRPVVLVPAEAASWESDWRRIVLLHELAHIKRRDCLTQMLANWACALFWFHPLVWWAARRLRVERELACDDYVLETGTRASEYASYLVELAKTFDVVESATPVAVGMACSHLEQRVRAILDPALRRSIPSPRRLAMLILVVACAVAPLASLQATSQVKPAPAPPPAPAAPVIAADVPAEVIAQAKQLVAEQKKLAALEAKAEQGKLSAAEKAEMARVQVSISEMQEELQDKLALRVDEMDAPAPAPAPLPEAAPAPAAAVNEIQPVPSPAPLKLRSGRVQTEVSPELVMALAAIQDAKQNEKNKDNEQALTADGLIRLKMAGVTPEYIEAIKKAGLEDLSVRQISELKMHDVSPEFIKQAQAWSTEKLSARDLVNLKISGLTPDYINAMKQAGFDNLSLRKLSQMRLHGVTPEFAAAMKRAGLENLTADQVTQLRMHNVTEEFIKQAQGWGLGKLSVRDLLQIKMHGVTPGDAAAWKALGYDNLTLRDLTNIRMHGITEGFIKEMRDLGFDKLTLNQLLQLKMHGITADYIRRMRAAGFKNISANDLLKLKIQGIDSILLKN